MSKFEEVLDQCKKQMGDINVEVDETLLSSIAKSLGPSIYNKDALAVAASQQGEMDNIKKNFLVKKLGLEDGPELDKIIGDAVEKIGKGNRNKLRPVFYYLIVKALGKESVYS